MTNEQWILLHLEWRFDEKIAFDKETNMYIFGDRYETLHFSHFIAYLRGRLDGCQGEA